MEPAKTYGPVQDGKLTHLAVTGVAQFNPDEEGCPSKWFYDNVEKRPRVEKPWHTKGTEVDDQINHFLSIGQNVLGKIARAGMHILPTPGPDLLVQWGLNNKLRGKKPDGRWKNFFPPQESKLWAAGVPFVGFPDVINPREEYLIPSDDSIHQKIELRSEPGVVEVLDNKTTSDFKWAKKSDALLHTTQMNGYGLFVAEIEPAVVGVRLSHNIYRTDDRMAPAAIKRSVLVSVKEIRERWVRVVEPVVEQMKSVAATKRDVDVPYNLGACESFGGCPHKDYCHAQAKLKQLNPIQRMKMSTLLKNRNAAAAPAAVPANGVSNTPWIPPQPPAPPSAAAAPPPPPAAAPPPPPQIFAQQAPPPVAAAPPPPPAAAPPPPQVAAAPPPQPTGPTPIAAGACVQNQQYWVNQQLMQYLCSTNGKQAFVPIVNGTMQGTPVHVPYEAMVFPAGTVGVVAAPAAPAPVAQAPAAPPPPPAAPTEEKKARGRKPKTEAAATTAPTASAQDFTLFVNSIPKGAFTDLAGYVSEAVEDMRNQFGVPDIRVAPDDSPIAFAKWRGVLAGMVRAEPPAPGVYVAFTKGSEFTEVVVEALWPIAGPSSARAF